MVSGCVPFVFVDSEALGGAVSVGMSADAARMSARATIQHGDRVFWNGREEEKRKGDMVLDHVPLLFMR